MNCVRSFRISLEFFCQKKIEYLVMQNIHILMSSKSVIDYVLKNLTCPSLYDDAPYVLWCNKNYCLAAAANIGYSTILQNTCSELRADREFILYAVKQNAYALQYANAELRKEFSK